VERVTDGRGSQAAGNDCGVKLATGLVVLREHLAGDLSVTGFVCADEAKLVSADDRNETVEEKEASDDAEDKELLRRFGGQPFPDAEEPCDGSAFFPSAVRGRFLKVTHWIR
jgi:hypothetical protein